MINKFIRTETEYMRSFSKSHENGLYEEENGSIQESFFY